MKQLYTASIVAKHAITGSIQHVAVAVLSPSDQEAIAVVLETGKERFPEEAGWHIGAALSRVPAELVLRAASELQDTADQQLHGE